MLPKQDTYTFCMAKTRKNKKALDFSKAFSALEGSRTPNLLIRSQVLYPIKLRMHFRVIGLQK